MNAVYQKYFVQYNAPTEIKSGQDVMSSITTVHEY